MLDDVAALRRLDRSRVLDRLASFADQFSPGLKAAPLERLGEKPRAVVVGGMGGSAVAGDVAQVWCDADGDVPIVVSRGYHLPAWAGPDTPFVAVSYSGSTNETLVQTTEAFDRGMPVASVTSGGALAALAEDNGAHVVRVPSALPRGPGHVGTLIAGVVSVLQGWGVAPPMAPYKASVSSLASWCRAWHVEVPEAKNLAKQVARLLAGRMPAVYAARPFGPVAARWANQLGENAKVIAVSGEIPEADHNEIVGWEEDARARGFAFVVLRGGTESGEMARRMDLTAALFERASGGCRSIVPEGASVIERLLYHLCLGDWVSVYAALAAGHDPVPTPAIDRLKAALKAR